MFLLSEDGHASIRMGNMAGMMMGNLCGAQNVEKEQEHGRGNLLELQNVTALRACELLVRMCGHTGKLRMGNMGMGGVGMGNMGPMACSGCSCNGSGFGGGCVACGSCGMPNCGMVPGACGNHMGCGGCGHCGVGCGCGCGACGCWGCGGCGNFGLSAPNTPPELLAAAAAAAAQTQNCGSGHCGLGCGCGNFGGVPAPVTPPDLLAARSQNCGMEIAHMGGCGGCCGSRCGCGWSSDGADVVMRVMEEMPSFVAQDPRGFVLRSAVPSSHTLSLFGFSIHAAENCGMMQFGHHLSYKLRSTPHVGSNKFEFHPDVESALILLLLVTWSNEEW